MHIEKRRFHRQPCNYEMRVYTSIKKGAYSVKVADIGQGGAFIKSNHLPQKGETISFELISNDSLSSLYMGNAKVCHVCTESTDSGPGFGVMFDKLLDQSLIDSTIVF